MRLIASTALVGALALLAGVYSDPTVTVDRYFGPTVDAFDLADMCSIDSDPIACLIVLGDPATSDVCEVMREAPTDSNIQACFGWTDEEMFTPVLSGGE